jgi:hypothetical protein
MNDGGNNRNRGRSFLRRLQNRTAYLRKWLPSYGWQRLTRRAPAGGVHLIIALADHYEPSIVPGNGAARAPLDEQERRVEEWCRQCPQVMDRWRDHDGMPFRHSYFFPAEQYERAIVDRLAQHCHAGWGDIEIHLHHGIEAPDTADSTRRQLLEFRDILAERHGCLSYRNDDSAPQYAFVHGNFALANSVGGYGCGVDSEMQILAETGCYADLTMPAAAFHRAQIGKINSLYECGLPLDRRAPHAAGRDLEAGLAPKVFPLQVQGPLMLDFDRSSRSGFGRFENAALTAANPPSLRRLKLWKKAGITVHGRPDWLFIKLHTHSMDPTQKDAVLGDSFQKFLRELVEGADQRRENLHFVTAREMVNIILAACDGKDGSPGGYRDYRFKMGRRTESDVSSERRGEVPQTASMPGGGS